MRLLRLILGDIRFQMHYGFYALYAILTAVYLLILLVLPQSVRQIAATITLFSDPAAMGLFFMGAIVLLEKSQRVNASLAVSPVKIGEYITAKAISLALIGTLVAVIIALIADTGNILIVAGGVFLSSVFFSLCGLFVASKIDSLNQFMIAVVPLQIIIVVPAMLYLFGLCSSPWFFIHPAISAIELIEGSRDNAILCIVSLLAWSALAFVFCHKAVKKSFSEMGGGSL